MQGMAVGMLLFALSVAVATFIENDFGTDTAKAEIYWARWFEVLLIFLVINLISNMLRYKMHKSPFSMRTIFHASFIIILLGAGVTRYFGYEGILHIREGETENRMVSSKSYVQMNVKQAGTTSHYEKSVLFSKLSSNSFDQTFSNGTHEIKLELLEYVPSASYGLVEDPKGKPMFSMMVVGDGGPQDITLEMGQYYENATHVINFGAKHNFAKPVINIYVKEGALMINHGEELFTMSMDTKEQKSLPASEATAFERRILHGAGNTRFVLKGFFEKASRKLVSNEKTSRNRMKNKKNDALLMRVSMGEQQEEFTIFGSSSAVGFENQITLGDTIINVSYGSKLITLPFAIHLKDFELERYPGSMAPSSYASEVILLDQEQGLKEPYRIYMNHVLDHKGFRLFQSSYDNDELGTVLSVNYDFWGTWITYVGYILLAFGMFGSFLVKKGRFQTLRKKLASLSEQRQALAALFAALMISFAPALQAEDSHAGHNHAPGKHGQPAENAVDSHAGHNHAPGMHQPAMSAQEMVVKNKVSKAHAKKFGRILVQSSGGRLEPVDSLGRNVLLKVHKKASILGLNSNQVILGMMSQPQVWSQIKMIKLGNVEIAKLIKLDPSEKYASFSHFYPMNLGDTYVLEHYVSDARRKPPKERNRFDKALLKVDEAVHICRMVYTGVLLNMFPKKDDPAQKWHHLIEVFQTFDQQTALEIRTRFLNYFAGLDYGYQSDNWEKADAAVADIVAYQKEVGATIYPSDFAVTLEILYNNINIFQWLMIALLIIGSIMILVAFVKIVNPKVNIERASLHAYRTLVGLFVIYTLGLIARWIISGHAPWSNGYEALVYIGWSTIVAGFLVSKHSPLTLAATAMLSGITLLVAMISSFDPQITNLVPVLKSYWLTIHVSMITASYGFLGLAALLGFIGLLLFVALNDKNTKRLSLSIKELNLVSEMAILMGLVLLTVGNFLGGVWANESWGRYWGWDAKETWALVSILIYATVAHIRYIPKFYTEFRYSMISLVSFSTILMTFFGVNYYLSGLHSYAKGDPVPVPTWVYIAIVLVLALIALAWRNKGKLTK